VTEGGPARNDRDLATAESQAAVEAARDADALVGGSPDTAGLDLAAAVHGDDVPSSRQDRDRVLEPDAGLSVPGATAEVVPPGASMTRPPDRAGGRDDHVEVRDRGAERVEAETVSIVQGGAARVDARRVDVHQGGIALARTDRLALRDRSSALAVVAARADVSDSNVFVLVARDVTGTVRPVLDWRAAAAFGVAFAIVPRLLRRAITR
jgi:hypothetical protein